MILFGVETLRLIFLRDQLQKRLSRPVVVAKSTQHHRGDGTQVLFLESQKSTTGVSGYIITPAPPFNDT